MHDGYVGDIGDYGKYGLLDTIFRLSEKELNIGINWYYVSGSEVGNHTEYLDKKDQNSQKYRKCFPEIYEFLKNILQDDNPRSIKEIEKKFNNFTFFSDALPDNTVSPEDRDMKRKQWFSDSKNTLRNCDIIFLDPDNGIQPKNLKKSQKRSEKYVCYDEIQDYFQSDHSLIIYNHRDRKPVPVYNQKIIELGSLCGYSEKIRVLRFKRVSVRDYIFFSQIKHQDLIDKTINLLTRSPFDFLFGEYSVYES